MKTIYKPIICSLVLLSFNAFSIELSECRIGEETSVSRIKAECGHLAVPENREKPSRMIDLNIAIIRTKATKKLNDPVIMLAGGPGQSAIETFPQVVTAFKGILKKRDVVLVDQRGTGGSNKLACDFDKETIERMIKDESIITNELAKCVRNFDADTRYYTTQESIKDLEEVRKALGIEQWNLVGVSYGTRKASTYMKMFPESIRTVVLDSVVPHQEPLAQSHEKNLVNALRKQFAQCEKQTACKEAFGDVEEQMWQLFERVEKDKPKIRLQNFSTGDYEEIEITKQFLTIAIRMFAYSPASMRLLPLLIDKANHGQLETLASQSSMVANMMQKSFSNVELSILCAEDIPFFIEYEVADRNIFGADMVENMQRNCDVWPHLTIDKSFKEAVTSDIPTLLLSGELDPVTPPEFAELAMKTLSNSQHLVAKGQGHNIFHVGCMPEIVSAFINEPDEKLDTECMNDFDYTPFFINMNGPEQ